MRLSTLMPVFTLILAFAVPAGAVTYTVADGAPDPGPAAGESLFVNFDDPLPGGYSLTGDYSLASGTLAGQYAAPAKDESLFLYTSSPIATDIATLHTIDQTTISFYWGSIESDNAVDILGLGDVTLLTLTGTDILTTGKTDMPQVNRRLFIMAQDDEIITGLRFRTAGSVFEVDNVAGTLFTQSVPSPLPEPADWVLMINGLGMVGLGARGIRKRNTAPYPTKLY